MIAGPDALVRGHLLAREVLTLRNFVLCAPTRRRSGQLVVGPSEASFFCFLNQRASCTTFETKFEGSHDPPLKCRFWRLVEHTVRVATKNPPENGVFEELLWAEFCWVV